MTRLLLPLLCLGSGLFAADLYLPPIEAQFNDPDRSARDISVEVLQRRGFFSTFEVVASASIGADGVVQIPSRQVKKRTWISLRFSWRESGLGKRNLVYQFKCQKGKTKVQGKRRVKLDSTTVNYLIDNQSKGDCGNLFQLQDQETKLILTLNKPQSYLDCADPEAPFTNFDQIGNRPINKGQLNYYSFDDDIRMGSDFAANMDSKGREQNPILNDPLVEGYVTDMVDRIAKASDMPDLKFRIQVIDADVVNAFALPGGFLYVYRGLIERTQDEAELAGVLAHEVAHVTSRHGTEGVTAATNKVAVATAVGELAARELDDQSQLVVGLTRNLIQASTQFWIMGGGRKRETEADYLGAQYAWRAGYDPRGIAMFFTRMSEGKQQQGTRLDKYFSGHPPDEKRIADNTAQVEHFLPPTKPVGNSQAYRRVKARLAQLPKSAVSGEAAGNALFSSFQQANQIILEREIAARLVKPQETTQSQTP